MTNDEQTLRFGPVGTRAIAISLVWPLLLGYAVMRASGLSLAPMIFAGIIAAIGALRSWRLGLSSQGDELVVYRLIHTERVSARYITGAYFGDPLLPGFACLLRLRLQKGGL